MPIELGQFPEAWAGNLALNWLFVMYSALAVAKMLPKVYSSNWLSGRSRRSQNRSIYPDTDDHVPTGPMEAPDQDLCASATF